MLWKIVLAAGLGAAMAVPASAEAPAKAPRQCFFTNQVNSFSPVDDQTVNVRVGVRDVYQLTLFSPCPDIRRNEGIALTSRGTTSICSGLDAEVITHSPIGPQRCPVQTIRKLSPEEVAALSHKHAH